MLIYAPCRNVSGVAKRVLLALVGDNTKTSNVQEEEAYAASSVGKLRRV
jgi:hypothetical protein